MGSAIISICLYSFRCELVPVTKFSAPPGHTVVVALNIAFALLEAMVEWLLGGISRRLLPLSETPFLIH